MSKQTHGGQREGAGPPREMTEPIRVTITLERAQLKQLKTRHGRNWQRVIRNLVGEYLERGE